MWLWILLITFVIEVFILSAHTWQTYISVIEEDEDEGAWF